MNTDNFVSNLVQPDCSFPSLNNLLGHHALILLVTHNCNIAVVLLFHLSRVPLSLIFWFLLYDMHHAEKGVEYSFDFCLHP